MSPRTLARWRWLRQGPVYFKLGSKVAYRVTDIDEFERANIRVARKLKATDVIEALCELFVSRGIPAHIRSDNGP